MDDVESLLSPSEPLLAAYEDRAWQNTCLVLRRRRWLRRARQSAMLAALFAAGMGAMWMIRPADQGVREIVEIAPRPFEPLLPQGENRLVGDLNLNQPPIALERLASRSSGEKRVALYRRAGDRFLEFGDESGALRCYRRALDVGSREDLVVDASDSWLLISMKMARQKEKGNARY